MGQHVEDGQAVLGGSGEVGRIERIADDVAVPVLPVDPRARVIQMLPRTAGQPRLVEGLCLSVEGSLAFDQEVRHLSIGDLPPPLRNSSATFGSLICAPKYNTNTKLLIPGPNCPL
jgi:hypothetical protein